MFNSKCYNCKNGRHMTSTGWIICHGFTYIQKANEILDKDDEYYPEYEESEISDLLGGIKS